MLLTTVAALLAAGVYVTAAPKRYVAEADLLVTPISVGKRPPRGSA